MLPRCRQAFALLFLLSGIFGASQAGALGLGQLTVDSRLNEPLDATIQLLDLDGLNASQIIVAMGGIDDFERANIQRQGIIDDIKIEVEVLSSREGLLHLRTEDPVVEPFLNFIISTRWPNGRLMREYTALLDLPRVVDQAPEVTVQEPEAPAVAPAVEEDTEEQAPQAPAEPEPEPQIQQPVTATPEPAAEEPAPEPAQETAQEVSDGGERSVTIQVGDTLYAIARDNRPSDSVTVEQTMLAIQRANPDAFINDNINNIRTGQVLRIPSIQQIRSLDQSQAASQVAQQNRASASQPLAVTSNSGTGAAEGNDELAILTGEDGTEGLTGDSDLASTIAALENQLALSEENLDRAKLEYEELSSRFAELEEQIEILQNIIAIEDQRLAQLQADLATQAEEAAQAVAEAEAQQAAAAPATTPAAQPPVDNSLMGRLSAIFENTIVLLSSLLVLVLLVLGFLIWRRRAAQAEMEDYAIADAAAATAGTGTFEGDEDVGGIAGFIAALKERFSRGGDDDEEEDEEDIEVEEEAAAEEISDEAGDEEEEDEDEKVGLLDKLKGLFSRSGSDEDLDEEEHYEEEDEEYAGKGEDTGVAVEDLEEEQPEELAGIETEEEDFDEGVDEDIDEEEEGGEVDVVFDDETPEEETEEEPEQALEEEPEEEVAEEILFDEDEDTDEVAEESEAIAGETEQAEEVAETAEAADEAALEDADLDLGDFGDMDLTLDEEEGPGEESEEEPEALEFGLSESAEAAEPEVEEETAEEVESFDFTLDESAGESDAGTEEAPADEEVESFDFKVEQPAAAPEEEAEEQGEDVESLDFDVSSVSSFDEEPGAESAEEAEEKEEVETFEFNAAATESAESAEAEEQEEAAEEGLQDLAAALDEIDAEAGSAGGAEEAEETMFDLDKMMEESDKEAPSDDKESPSDDDDFDLGNIDIDDSLFDSKEEEEAPEPITDRDESSTKLDLAVAYEAMGDLEGAKEILEEVIAEGSEDQIAEAKKLLEKWEQS